MTTSENRFFPTNTRGASRTLTPYNVRSTPSYNTIKDLPPSSSGYSELQLKNSGRKGTKKEDGTIHYEGFYIAPNGNYYPVNLNAVKGSSPNTDYDSGSQGIAENIDPGSDCNPNYSVCLPNVGDLNCGDIPYKRFQVIGVDVYGLDRDGDGIACER